MEQSALGFPPWLTDHIRSWLRAGYRDGMHLLICMGSSRLKMRQVFLHFQLLTLKEKNTFKFLAVIANPAPLNYRLVRAAEPGFLLAGGICKFHVY